LPSQRSRARFIALGLWFFATSSFWRLHLERGQIYVYHLLLLSGIASLWLRGRYDSWTSGVLLGALIAIRPVFGTLAVAAASSRWWKTSFGSLAGFLAVVLLTLPLVGVDGWRGYLVSVRSYDDRTISQGRAAADKPTIAEGYDFEQHLRTAPQLTVKRLAERYNLRRTGITSDQLARFGAVACALAIALIGLTSAGRRPGRATVGLFFAIAVVTEYFMPVRWPYVNIVWLLPLACIAPLYTLRSRMALLVATLLVLGLFAGHTFFGIAPSLERDLIRTATLIATTVPPLALIWWAGLRRAHRLRSRRGS
jgi:hypothetical protein